MCVSRLTACEVFSVLRKVSPGTVDFEMMVNDVELSGDDKVDSIAGEASLSSLSVGNSVDLLLSANFWLVCSRGAICWSRSNCVHLVAACFTRTVRELRKDKRLSSCKFVCDGSVKRIFGPIWLL